MKLTVNTGKRVQAIGTALGMRVMVAERKGTTEVRDGRVSFDRAVREGTVSVSYTHLTLPTKRIV